MRDWLEILSGIVGARFGALASRDTASGHRGYSCGAKRWKRQRRVTRGLATAALLLLTLPLHADPLGEFLLSAIEKDPKARPTDAALLLLTRDLGWYEKNMVRLPDHIQAEVQQLRIRIVGESTRRAAEALGEPADVFLASGSCKPGRDIDLLYVGRDVRGARGAIDSAIGDTTAAILAEPGTDPLLAAARNKKLEIPGRLDSNAMEVVASDLPNFGYKDLKDAFAKAKAAQQAGDPDAVRLLRRELHEALKQNLEAQVKSSAKDMYRGAAGQRFFAVDYLGDEAKVRWIARDASGVWQLRPGGFEALSHNLTEQVAALMPTSRRAKFAKVASDYAMYFKHADGGLGGTAKYVERIWTDVDAETLLIHTEPEEAAALTKAREIAHNPQQASRILAGTPEAQVRDGVKRAMHQVVENQLIMDLDRLVRELEQVQGGIGLDDLEVLYRKQLIQFDLNDLANGLAALSDVPDSDTAGILRRLQHEFGNSDVGRSILRYVERQFDLLRGSGGNEVAARLLRHLWATGEIDAPDYYETRMRLATGAALDDGPVAKKLEQARREILVLSAVDMLDVSDDPRSIDNLIGEWKRQRTNAVLRTVTPELRQTAAELATLPGEELKKLGWLEVELQLPLETRLKVRLLPDQLADLGERLGARLSRRAIALMEWQRKARQYIFSLTPTEFGEPGDLGAMDAVFAVASGLFQTYSILNSSPPMSAEEERIALGNAWVTSLPVVGDFAEGALGLSDWAATGNRRRAAEAGLYVAIGIMGIVPGGQIPAMVTSLVTAAAPLAQGILDAREAQSLIQAWIASGVWEASGKEPPVLTHLVDRADKPHALTYQDLLSDKGEVPYRSEAADGYLSVPTISGSIRQYAEDHVFPQYPELVRQRETLQTLLTKIQPSNWDSFYEVRLLQDGEGNLQLKFNEEWVERHGAKVAVLLFRRYQVDKVRVLKQTIAQLKAWAEEERRVAADYDGEIAQLKTRLHALQVELKVGLLIAHADRTANSYAKIVKNAMEQQTLPLSRYRIYKHYVQEYEAIAALVRKIKARLAAIPDGYRPANWFLTGYPEFDRPRITKLAAMIENGHRAVVGKVVELLDHVGFRARGGYDPDNACHREAYNTLARLRHRVSFIENLVDYLQTLAGNESAWSDAYESARSRYIEAREGLVKTAFGAVAAESKALADAAMTFVAAMPYALAAGERDLYRRTAEIYAVKMQQAQKDFRHAGFLTGPAGKPLEDCLLGDLKVEIALDPYNPVKGGTTIAHAKLAGALPSEYIWRWELEGPLKAASPYGARIEVVVDGAGELIARVMDHFDPRRADVLAEGRAVVVPVEPKDDDPQKKDPDRDQGDDAPDSGEPGEAVSTATPEDLRMAVDAARAARDWKRLAGMLVIEKKARLEREPNEYLARLGVINQALYDLKQERLAWLLEWKEYLAEVQRLSDAAYSRIYHAMERKRDEFQQKCNAECEDCQEKCQKAAYRYYDDCVGQLKLDHWEESRRLRESLKVLRDRVQRLHSGGYEHADWFREVEALSEEHGLPFPYPDPVVPRLNYVTECLVQDAPGAPGRKDQPDILQVKLAAPTAIVEVGQPLTVVASVSGGTPAYRYAWSGITGSGNVASLTPTHVGDWTIELKVTDAEGLVGRALATVRVGPGKVQMKGLKPNVIYASRSPLNAWGMGMTELPPQAVPAVDCAREPDNPFCVDTSHPGTVEMSDGRVGWRPLDTMHGSQRVHVPHPDREEEPAPAPRSKYKIIWQAEPTLTFDPPDSPDGRTMVTYDQIGEVKVWCELLEEIEGAFHTVGECEQQTVMIGPPAFSVQFEPANGMAHVGQRVTATVKASPYVPSDLVDYRWFEPPSSNRLHLTQNGGRMAFTVLDTNPVKLRALARVPVHGDEIAEVIATYTGTAYGVRAWMVQPPTLPQTWDPVAGGLKTIERSQRATGELITLKAELQGRVIPDEVRWHWQVNPGTTISNPNVQSPTVSRSAAGEVSARVVASDREGRRLGEAEVRVTVVELMPAPATVAGQKPGPINGATPSASADPAVRRLADAATRHAAAGDMPAAEQAAKAVMEKDPTTGARVAREVAKAASAQGWKAMFGRDFEAAVRDLEVAERLAPADTVIAERLQKTRRFARTWPAVEAKAAEFDRLLSARRIWSAHRAMNQMGDLQREMPGGMNNPLSKRVMNDFHAALAQYNAFVREKTQLNTRHFKEKDWQAMLDSALETRERWELSAADAREVQGRIDLARQRLREAAAAARAAPAAADGPLQAPARPRSTEPPDGAETLATVTANTAQRIEVALRRMRVTQVWIVVTEASEKTAGGGRDSARIGEVTFFDGARELKPAAVSAGSDYGRGYSAAQINDGKPYRYLRSGAAGWASAPLSKGQSTWVRFDFAEPVEADRVVVATAPTRPYRLHSLRFVAKPLTQAPGDAALGLIRILSASYGGNQGAPLGNVTRHIATACDGKARCAYRPDYRVIGDPAPGLAKDYVVVFRCGPMGQPRQLALAAPTGFGDTPVTIDCQEPNGWRVDWPPPAVDAEAGQVRVLSATYGGNQGVPEGNVTAHIAEACNGRHDCRYAPNYQLIGDPAPGKPKDYSVRYRCGNDGDVREIGIPAPAGFGDKVVRLDCRVKRPTPSSEASAAAAGPATGAAGQAAASRARFELVVVPGGIGFEDARKRAEAMGGRLATIVDAADNAAAYAVAAADDRAWYVDGFGNGIGPWLGGKETSEGRWAWIDGTPWRYTNWAARQPDNAGGRESHLQFFGTGELKSPYWNDIPPDLPVRGFVVEYPDATQAAGGPAG